MRNWITLCEWGNVEEPREAKSFDGIVYHCSNARFDQFRVDPNRGVYFSNEPDHEYGQFVYRCHLRLNNAAVYDSDANMEIDRPELIEQGFDGRIVDYANETFDGDAEMWDFIAFHAHQIEILEIIERS